MEMNLIGRIFVNSFIWNYLNKKFLMPLIFDNLLREDYARVLDLGCGIGYTSREVANRLRNAEVFGVDYDRRQIRKANRRNKSRRIRFLVGDGKNLGFSNGYFDAVFAFDTMHHIEDYEEAIEEMSRVLRKNGDIYVLDVDKKFFNPVIKWIDNTQSLFSREEFIDRLKEHGFRVYKEGKRLSLFYAVARKFDFLPPPS
ncbi:MAG: class I SAM-dependent methyltransferase [Nanoarchaeota archaeon]